MPTGLRRNQLNGANHFITFSCYQRLPFLASDHARTVFLEELERIRIRHGVRIFGYVLMPEHVHLLMSEPKKYVLATTLNVLKHETSQRLKTTQKQFWQRRYYDFNIETHDKFLEKLRYTHRNPVARGLVERPEEYRWSSFNHWATGQREIVEIESKWTWNKREREGIPHDTVW
ncbi:transposase [Granulicella cerasi]|uniref:Transposase n=1 Tax=Granulicella cerasi TaxID=741063 RepID=A0ABW1Z6P9_9BACT|nr:transposase [Granulicella cerasi]